VRPHNRSGDVVMNVMKYVAIIQIILGTIMLYGTVQDDGNVGAVIYGLGAWIIIFIMCKHYES
jgi:hypothetical protein